MKIKAKTIANVACWLPLTCLGSGCSVNAPSDNVSAVSTSAPLATSPGASPPLALEPHALPDSPASQIVPEVSESESFQPVFPVAFELPLNKKMVLPVHAKSLAPRFSPKSVPSVILSNGHQATSRVIVGDTFPNLNLVDVGGVPVNLASFYGERLTIVVFWNSRLVLAREQFHRIQKEIASRYGIQGVSIVAINTGESLKALQKTLFKTPQKFSCLADVEQEFKKVATEKLPRTYLLDSKGKIVWFDIEWSRLMLLDLDNAVHHFLAAEK